jgi:50S ribosomal protein L16 3-hydroxylase
MKKPSTRLPWPVLGKLSQQEFLSKYWQKKPLLMKGALSPMPDLITPDEVAGLSCDPRVESRLILEKGGKTPWELRKGPFKPSLFAKLPKTHWTILVNGVDRFVPALNGFLDHFSFVPFWRIDDVMISVAYDKGNVGAHVDNYDVFLVQGAGKREWMIEDKPVMHDDFVPGLPIRLLKRFKPTHRWVLEPGDILYLPPRFPHHGIAQGDGCMTISVGFRAPSTSEIINGIVTDALAAADDTIRYRDPELRAQAPGEIPAQTITKIQKMLEQELLSKERITEWLGRYVSESYSDVTLSQSRKPLSAAALRTTLQTASTLVRAEGARCVYMQGAPKGALVFYANGERFDLDGAAAALAKLIADSVVVPLEQVRRYATARAAGAFLSTMIQRGIIVID